MQAALLAADIFDAPSSLHHGKPAVLLPLGGARVLDHVMASLCAADFEPTVHICTGREGYPPLREWLRGCDFTGRAELFRCGERAGEVAMLDELVIRRGIREPMVVLGGGSLLDFPLGPFLKFSAETEGDVVGISTTRRAGGLRASITSTSEGRVIDLATGRGGRKDCSIYPVAKISPETLVFAGDYLGEGGDPARISALLERSYRIRPLYAFHVEGGCHPLSSERSLKKISSLFEKKV